LVLVRAENEKAKLFLLCLWKRREVSDRKYKEKSKVD